MKNGKTLDLTYITNECQEKIQTVLKGLGAEIEVLFNGNIIQITEPSAEVVAFLQLLEICDCGQTS